MRTAGIGGGSGGRRCMSGYAWFSIIPTPIHTQTTKPDEQSQVALSDLDEVAALAADLIPRVALLNTWLAEVKQHAKKTKAAKKAGKGDAGGASRPPAAPAGLNAPPGELAAAAAAAEAGGKVLDPSRPPPEVTKYDFKPPLDVDDDDGASQ